MIHQTTGKICEEVAKELKLDYADLSWTSEGSKQQAEAMKAKISY